MIGLSVVLVCRCMLPPASDWVAEVLVGRLDDDVSRTITGSLLAAFNLSTLEDSAVQDQLAQARGMNGLPVPHAVRIAAMGLQSRLAALGSLILVAFYLSWWSAILLVAALALASQVLAAAWRVEFRSWPDQAEAQRQASYFFELGMGEAAKEVRVFGLATWLRESHLDQWMQAMRPVWHARRRTRIRAFLAVIPLAGSISAVLLYLISQVRGGHVDIAAATSSAAATLAVLAALSPHLTVLAQRGARTLEALDAIPESVAPDAAAPSPLSQLQTGHPHTIRLHQVSYRYPGQDRDALTDLDLEIRAGESFALVGVNGAGKSTLVKLLTGMISPTSGQITIDGIDLARLHLPQWHTQIAVVMQDFLRLPLTASQNVAIGHQPPHDIRAMDQVAERAAFDGIVRDLPNGWDTPLDRNQDGGTDLSGGQWQRLALVRALWAAEQGASLLILDEPAAALDIRAEAELVGRFLDLAAGLTTLTISHRFSVVRGADRIGVLDGGRIVESGTHDTLLRLDGRYAAMFRAQGSLYLTDADNPPEPNDG
ncbi:hypothetical protein BIV57_00540 [Mangrovactinospora gilvigrisea]|uniref:ABC transporter domain-containing protein n=1 Tax=Mangrovactinospora gilvigrisea TaxID=1428644 RepID=A0A1J7BL05_9ACTN|nr:hypothetical protein BIV57_00540 [Mangrovactinospora gilvigrisea]